jgi:long-subunit fatty acid transport protein
MPRRPCALALATAAAAALAGAGRVDAQVAASLNRSGSGARAAGMANAFVAVSDDGTAASWNPAGLAQLRRPEFSLVYTIERHETSQAGMRSADGAIGYSNRDVHATSSSPDFTSAALPFTLARKPVTVQLGWQRVYQLTNNATGQVWRLPMNDPAAAPELILLDNESRGDIDRFLASAAIKLSSRVSVGGSLNFFRGRWADEVGFIEPANGSADFAALRQNTRISGENVTAGILLTWPRLNVGLVYNTAFWSDYDFSREQRSNRVPPESYQGGSQGEFRFPSLAAGGVAWRPAPRWTVALDVTHDQWTDTLVRGLAGRERPFNFFDGARPDFTTTRDTTSWSVGGEHLFLREGSVIPLRMGFAWEPQGAMDPVTRDPIDIYMVAVGGGYNTNRLKFDAALQYRWGSYETTDIFSVESALSGGRDALGRTRTGEWRLKVSAIYRIPSP